MLKKITLFTALMTVLATTALAQTTDLEFWYAFSDAPRSGWIEDRISEFNAQLVAEGRPYRVVGERKGSYPETLEAAVLAARTGNPPHLVQLYEVGSQLAVDSGIFQPVGEVYPGFDFSDYIQPVLNYYTIGGQVNSIPFNRSSPILYVNLDLLEAAGLPRDLRPETYGEVLEACETIAASPVTATCFGVSLNGWFVEQWVSQQNANLVDNGNGRSGRATEVLLTSPAVTNVVEWLKALNDGGHYSYTGRLEDWDGSDAIFTNQQVVFHVTSTADLGNISSAAEAAGFALGTGLLPIADGVARNGVVIGGASIWLAAGHPQVEQEVAVDFALYLTNTENMISWHKLTGYYPVRVSSVDALTAEGWFSDFPERNVAFTQLLNTVPNEASAGALMGVFQATRTIVEEAIQKVFAGASVSEALEEAKRLADAALAEYNANF